MKEFKKLYDFSKFRLLIEKTDDLKNQGDPG